MVHVAVIVLEASTAAVRTPVEPKASAPALIVQLAVIVTDTVKLLVAVAASATRHGRRADAKSRIMVAKPAKRRGEAARLLSKRLFDIDWSRAGLALLGN